MKKILIYITAIIVIALSGCSSVNSEISSEKETEIQVQSFSEPVYYDSFDKFEKDIDSHKEKEILLQKASLTDIKLDNYTFNQIAFREDVYITSLYTLDGYKYNDKYTYQEYANERMSTAIYEAYLYPDAQKSLEINFIEKGYEKVEIDGDVYYYYQDVLPNDGLIGHEFAYVTGNNLVYIHLPGSIKYDDLSSRYFPKTKE